MSFSLLEYTFSQTHCTQPLRFNLKSISQATPAIENLPFSKIVQLFHWFPKEIHSINFHCDFYGFTDICTVMTKGCIARSTAFHMKKSPFGLPLPKSYLSYHSQWPSWTLRHFKFLLSETWWPVRPWRLIHTQAYQSIFSRKTFFAAKEFSH